MRLFWFFTVLAVLVLGTWMIWGGGWESRFTLEGSVSWLRQAGSWAWAAGLLLLLGDLVLPVPGTVVISALGYLYGTLLGGMLAGIGLIGAGVAGYGIGRFCSEKTARRWLGERDFERGQAIFARGGGWVVALSRALPVLPEVVSCTAGLVRMPFAAFLTSLACGSFPMGFLFAAIGQGGHRMPGSALVLSLLVPAVLWAAASRIHRRNIGS